MPNIRVIKPTFLICNWKKMKFWTNLLNKKKSISFSHIKFTPHFISCPQNGRVVVIFSFLLLGASKTSEAIKKALILDYWPLSVPKKIGIGVGLHGKSALYLMYYHNEAFLLKWDKNHKIPHKLLNFIQNWIRRGPYYVHESGGGGQILDLQTSFLGRGPWNADGCRHEGGRGQK